MAAGLFESGQGGGDGTATHATLTGDDDEPCSGQEETS